MSITQLQAVVHQCQNLLNAVLKSNTNHSFNSEQTLLSLIKLRKQEISELKEELLSLAKQQKDKKQLAKYIAAIQAQIDSIRKFTTKQILQRCYLEQLSQKNRMKIGEQNQRIHQLHQEEQIMKEFQFYIQESIKSEQHYNNLQTKANEISVSMTQQKVKRYEALQQKQQSLKMMKQSNTNMQTKIAFLQNQISIQQQIISKIIRVENQQTPYPTIQSQAFQILNREAQAIFKKNWDFDIWEKHQIKNVIQKRQFEKQKQKRRIGSIARQPIHHTEFKQSNKTIKRKSFNYSADLTSHKKQIKHLPTTPTLIPIHFVSKQRINQLEKNKRIRTKFTPAKVSQPIVKPFIVQTIPQEQSISSSKHSILTIYQTFKKQKIEQNPSLIHFKRKGNKRIIVSDSKGVPLQSQSFE